MIDSFSGQSTIPTVVSYGGAPGKGVAVPMYADAAAASRCVYVSGRKYMKLNRIGKGGSGDVFRVLGEDNEIYALKIIQIGDTDEEIIEGYRREIGLLEALRECRYVINLVGWEEDKGNAEIRIVEEYGDTSFKTILEMNKEKGFDINFIRMYWEQMLEAVRAVHSNNVIHLDLKPENFVMAKGVLKLIDFGISRAIAQNTTNVTIRNVMGTVRFMPPESFSSLEDGADSAVTRTSRSADIWSLGVILYYMTYGFYPFRGDSNQEMIHKITSRSYTPPYQLSSGIPDDLINTIRLCLCRDRTKRPTAAELLGHPFLRNPDKTSVICTICREQRADYAIVPCGHVCVCENCSIVTGCPICGKDASMTMKIIFP